jgi:hypothetical protein
MNNYNDLSWDDIKAMIDKTSKNIAKHDRMLTKKFAETDKKIAETSRIVKELSRDIGGITKSNGEFAESYFVNSFSNAMQFAGQEYNGFDSRVRRKDKKLNLQGEYDLVLYNCTSAVIIEIKYKARKKDVQELLLKAPIFKQLFPQYANYGLYLGLAAFHFEENTEKESIDQGIAVIKQVGDNMVINDAHLKLF